MKAKIFLIAIILGVMVTTNVFSQEKQKTIVCFGDSITEGFNLPEEKSYPSILEKMIGQVVVNSGVSGETSRDGLKRVKRDVLAHQPDIVIIEFGANDYFNGIPLKETMGNIRQMVRQIKKEGAAVILTSIRMDIWDRYTAGYRKICKEEGGVCLANLLKGIRNNKSLMLDGIHPNESGNKVIAERIRSEISESLGN